MICWPPICGRGVPLNASVSCAVTPLLRRTVWAIYAVFFLTLVYASYKDDVSLGYPSYFTYPALIWDLVAACGVIFYAFDERHPSLVRAWKWVFPVLVTFPIVGLIMDAILPRDYNLRRDGLSWIANAMFNVALVTPAYVANWRFAHGRS